jgi:hypothetical protein
MRQQSERAICRRLKSKMGKMKLSPTRPTFWEINPAECMEDRPRGRIPRK